MTETRKPTSVSLLFSALKRKRAKTAARLMVDVLRDWRGEAMRLFIDLNPFIHRYLDPKPEEEVRQMLRRLRFWGIVERIAPGGRIRSEYWRLTQKGERLKADLANGRFGPRRRKWVTLLYGL